MPNRRPRALIDTAPAPPAAICSTAACLISEIVCARYRSRGLPWLFVESPDGGAVEEIGDDMLTLWQKPEYLASARGSSTTHDRKGETVSTDPVSPPPPDTAAAAPATHSRLRSVGRGFIIALAAIGAVSLVAVTVGASIDVSRIDETRGGYEAPYTGWTGSPIDWTEGGVTRAGFVRPGLVFDSTLDCTTGMIGFSIFGLSLDYRVVSERAIVVHRPRDACIEAGFTPQF